MGAFLCFNRLKAHLGEIQSGLLKLFTFMLGWLLTRHQARFASNCLYVLPLQQSAVRQILAMDVAVPVATAKKKSLGGELHVRKNNRTKYTNNHGFDMVGSL